MIALRKRKEPCCRALVKQTIRSLDQINTPSRNDSVGFLWSMITDRDAKSTNFACALEITHRLIPLHFFGPGRAPRLEQHCIQAIRCQTSQAGFDLGTNMGNGINLCNGCSWRWCPMVMLRVDFSDGCDARTAFFEGLSDQVFRPAIAIQGSSINEQTPHVERLMEGCQRACFGLRSPPASNRPGANPDATSH